MPTRRAHRPTPATVAHRNRDHTGVWIATYLERCEVKGEKLSNPNRRCLAWENTIILGARSREQAYRKAVRFGRTQGLRSWYRTSAGGRARWVFEGLTDLLPVYDELEDGSELFYREHSGRSVATVKKLVKRKEDLGAFRD